MCNIVLPDESLMVITELDLEQNYWTYVQGHPNHINLPPEAKYDAEDAILWSHAGQAQC